MYMGFFSFFAFADFQLHFLLCCDMSPRFVLRSSEFLFKRDKFFGLDKSLQTAFEAATVQHKLS